MATGDDYEFYPCLVDGAPASFYVNLRFERAAPPPNDTTRYTIEIALLERGEHGIGTADEASAVNLVEEAILRGAEDLGITYVGRLRTRGYWEIVLYGPAGHLGALRALASEHAADRRVVARSEHDPGWSYYRELLLPDAERRQWMDDRRMVEIIGDQGDRLVTPRRVDHRLAFPTPTTRDAFVAAATAAGFTAGSTADVADGDLPHCVHVHRVDPIELEHIHDVVMTLVDAATPHGGHYERWVAGLET
ncbi:MAG: DUF695 domain-containing protein [Deltaproteobacteria bacterium]|nr:DUF695 domain-containing protein [Deltaproteobacteria bacterium]